MRLTIFFQIKESPEGDWNFIKHRANYFNGNAFKLKNPRKGTETTQPAPTPSFLDPSFKLKNPRKGTETSYIQSGSPALSPFKLKNPRKGTETFDLSARSRTSCHFQIKESPEGDWNKNLKTF